VTCGNADAFRTLPPVRPRNQDPSQQKPSSAANHNDGHQAVALQTEAFWPVWAAACGGVSGAVQDSHIELRIGAGSGYPLT